MWLGQQTVSSLERCPLFRVSLIERLHCTFKNVWHQTDCHSLRHLGTSPAHVESWLQFNISAPTSVYPGLHEKVKPSPGMKSPSNEPNDMFTSGHLSAGTSKKCSIVRPHSPCPTIQYNTIHCAFCNTIYNTIYCAFCITIYNTIYSAFCNTINYTIQYYAFCTHSL